MSIIKRALLWLITILSIICVLLGLLLSTTSGLRMCVYFANYWVPQLTVEKISGHIFDLQLGRLRYQNEQISLQVEQLNYEINWQTLKKSLLTIDTLSAQTVELSLTNSPSQKVVVERLSMQGSLDFVESFHWRTEVQTNGIQTTSMVDGVQLFLDGEVEITGELKNEDWKIRFNHLNYQGKLNHSLVDLKGSILAESKGWLEADNLILFIGKNRIYLNGKLNPYQAIPNIALNASIEAPELSSVLPSIRGEVNGKVVMTSQSERPVLNFNFKVNRFSGWGTDLDEGRLVGYVSEPDCLRGKIRVTAKNLKSSEILVKKAEIQVLGNEKTHLIDLKANGSPIVLNTQLRGSYERNRKLWTVQWSKAEVIFNQQALRLSSPTAFSWDGSVQKLTLQPQCWGYGSAQFCLPNITQISLDGAQSFNVAMTLRAFDLQMINRFSDLPLRIKGKVNGDLNLTIAQGWQGLPQGQMSIHSERVSLIYEVADKSRPIVFEKLNLSTQFLNNDWTFKGTGNLKDNGTFLLETHVKDPLRERQLNGRLKVDAINMNWLESFSTLEEKVEGALKADLSFAGTLNQPRLLGWVHLDHFRIDSVNFPFEMKPSRLAMEFSGDRSVLEGKLLTQNGDLFLKGDAHWSAIEDIEAKLNVTSDRIRMMIPPMASLDVSTDVTAELSSDLLKLDGLIQIPWARVSVTELPQKVIDVSEDEVRLDQPKSLWSNSRTMPIQSNLFIDIGNDVKVDALGLKADLAGRLHVIQDQNRLGLNGQIKIPEGEFKAYGQSLEIRKGLLGFSGPMDNPSLDIEAVRSANRTADNVTVGVKVNGTAKNPQVTVFSNPSMSQGEALSYLLSGEGLDTSRENDSMIASALFSLGVNQGSRVLNAIGEVIGIDDLQLETEGVGENSQVTVSGYILPGLKVKYGVGLFDSLFTITLRYQIIPKLYLEVVSGVNQALDVLYQIDFD